MELLLIVVAITAVAGFAHLPLTGAIFWFCDERDGEPGPRLELLLPMLAPVGLLIAVVELWLVYRL